VTCPHPRQTDVRLVVLCGLVLDMRRELLTQAVAAALTEMMGYPVTLLQPGGRVAAGGDPMAISVPLTAGAGIRASPSVQQKRLPSQT